MNTPTHHCVPSSPLRLPWLVFSSSQQSSPSLPANTSTACPYQSVPHTTRSTASSSNWRTRVSAFCRLNVVQRCLSAAVLVPVVTGFLWWSPAFATATFCACITSLCAYEYAWLAHRIHTRILKHLTRWEQVPAPAASSSGSIVDSDAEHSNCRNSHSHSSSTRSESPIDTTATGQAIPPPLPPSPPPLSSHRLSNSPALLDTLNTSINYQGDDYATDFSRCAVSSVADKYFKGNEWFAALVLALIATIVTSGTFLWWVTWVPQLKPTEFYRLRLFYAFTTDYVAALSALFTPNWTYALICLIEKTAFTFLTVHSTLCPMNQFSCGFTIEPGQVFLTGVILILLFHLHTSRRASQASVLLRILLDMMGYLYIVGSLSVIVAFVDDEKIEVYRKLLIVLLYVVWASDTGAYLTGKLLERLNYSHYNPLAAHLSKNKDYEGTLGAILFGVSAMVIASDLLDVPGTAVAKVTFTVIAVIAGRIGDLFESLLKRAAEVKDSGKLIPGHGGVLDRIDALMFASLVFARYYSSQVS